jgi:hypothetical protein
VCFRCLTKNETMVSCNSISTISLHIKSVAQAAVTPSSFLRRTTRCFHRDDGIVHEPAHGDRPTDSKVERLLSSEVSVKAGNTSNLLKTILAWTGELLSRSVIFKKD